MDRNDDYYPSFHCPLVLRREFYRNSDSHYRDVRKRKRRRRLKGRDGEVGIERERERQRDRERNRERKKNGTRTYATSRHDVY